MSIFISASLAVAGILWVLLIAPSVALFLDHCRLGGVPKIRLMAAFFVRLAD